MSPIELATGRTLACDKDCKADIEAYIEATIDGDITNDRRRKPTVAYHWDHQGIFKVP